MRRRTTLLVVGDAGQRLHLATLRWHSALSAEKWETICGAELWSDGRGTGDAWEYLAFDKPLCRRCKGRLEELVDLAVLVVSPDLRWGQRDQADR